MHARTPAKASGLDLIRAWVLHGCITCSISCLVDVLRCKPACPQTCWAFYREQERAIQHERRHGPEHENVVGNQACPFVRDKRLACKVFR